MSENIQPLYDKKIQCPICSHSYTTKRVRSRFIRVEKVDSDFFTHYKDINPIFYEINVCSKCGYAFSDNFSTFFPPNSKEAIISHICSQWKERDFSGERTIQKAIASYKLAIVSGSLKKEKSIALAGICLRLAWLNRILNKQEEERKFLEMALNKYQDSFVEGDYVGTQMTEMRMLYLIGELSRRLGDREKAVKTFSKVINHKNRSFETKLVEMAREQWYQIRENDKDKAIN